MGSRGEAAARHQRGKDKRGAQDPLEAPGGTDAATPVGSSSLKYEKRSLKHCDLALPHGFLSLKLFPSESLEAYSV